MRPDREKAFLSRLSGRRGLQFWNAGMRPALLLLPELDDISGFARPERAFSTVARYARSFGARRTRARREGDGEHV